MSANEREVGERLRKSHARLVRATEEFLEACDNFALGFSIVAEHDELCAALQEAKAVEGSASRGGES